MAQRYQAHGLNRRLPRLLLSLASRTTLVSVRKDRFGYLVACSHNRVERGHGLLKDHADASAAQLPHFVVSGAIQVSPGKQDLTAAVGGRRQQSHDG
jgi:hypothetical protein